MNHPTNEQWMSFCYDEITVEERNQLSQHLQDCPQCSAALKAWQQTQQELNTWRLPVARRHAPMIPFVIKWAAAAVLLFTSFCLGRLSFTTQSALASLTPAAREQFRNECSILVQQEVNKAAGAIVRSSEEEAKRQFASAVAELKGEQAKSTRAVYAALHKMETQRTADYLSLKKDLDTLAVNADAQLRTTERHLLQVATLAQPSGTSITP